jgi:hypothetical protein
MLSFKHYLSQYPNGNNPKKSRRLSSLWQIKQSLHPKLKEDNTPYTKANSASIQATMSKRDLIKMISDQDEETVLVELMGDGIYFEFVQPKFKE